MIDIIVTDEDPAWNDTLPEYQALVERAVRAVFATCPIAREVEETTPSVEISVTLSNDNAVQILNRDYRGKDKPTNILSFAMQDSEDGWVYPTPDIPCMLGDLVVARETLTREATEEAKSVTDHFTHLILHGTLHLLGYDHIDDEDAAEMEGLEISILNNLGIKNPYSMPGDDGMNG